MITKEVDKFSLLLKLNVIIMLTTYGSYSEQQEPSPHPHLLFSVRYFGVLNPVCGAYEYVAHKKKCFCYSTQRKFEIKFLLALQSVIICISHKSRDGGLSGRNMLR
jgi:hypothetical protein